MKLKVNFVIEKHVLSRGENYLCEVNNLLLNKWIYFHEESGM